jgi:hypothetical protein
MQSSLKKLWKTKSNDDTSVRITNHISKEISNGTSKSPQEESKSADDHHKQCIDLTVSDNNSEKPENKFQHDLPKPTTRNVMKRGISIAVVPHRKKDITEPTDQV